MGVQESFFERFCLRGKVALITGGSRGIGHAIALGFAEAGADVAIASRKLADLESVAQEIRQKGRKAVAIAANLRHLPEIEKAVERVKEEFGRVDILVNNAGTNPVFGSVLDATEEAWEVIMGLNLKGYFFLSQKVGEIMRQQGGGCIINITSEAGFRPVLGLGVYSISKAGVIMLTQVLAQEWGQYNIRVNAIAPGVVKTRFAQALWDNPVISKITQENTALNWLAEPEDIVGAAIYLASDASRHMTGQTLVLDGGHFSSVRTLLRLFPER